MKRLYVCILTIAVLYGCGSTRALLTADKTPILASLDLNNVIDDKVKVAIDPGSFTTDEVLFYIPKTVPGTYSEDNYGKYIEGFKAFDYDGKELDFSKEDDNTWKIANGKQLDKVTYLVNDTYDTESEVDDKVFSPSGTNILAGENFMLNLHGFVGYFKGLKEVPYEITVSHPTDLKATTSLQNKVLEVKNDTADVFLANRYFEVIDNPIQYAEPNTETFQIKDIKVAINVYSPNGVYTATSLKERMEKMMGAQKAFLGPIDATKEYNILLYLSTYEPNDASGFGALEHHTSTVVVLPEALPKERLEQAMVDVVSHEFFHIVTPLSVHSKEVQYFDFNDPKMSQHLWMYEGTTEYFANLFQIQQGLIDEEEFYTRIVDKINNAKAYDDNMSFTTMSKNILKEPYEKNYANVYEKGALINMALDIELRKLSNGEKGVLWLMKELSKKYGKDTPFEDADLIDEIVAMTYPEIRNFFDTHVIGNTPVDYEEYLSKVGLQRKAVEKRTGYFLDGENPFIDVNESNEIYIRKGIQLSSFFEGLGIEGGDVLKAINGTEIDLEAIRNIIGQSFSWSPDKQVTMKIVRDGEKMFLEGEAGTPTLQVDTIVPVEGVSAKEAQLRENWLKG
ncbi:peptidase M61 [Pseudozobellia sp. WGM2]|uniref:M61 family metallopeptidase n=1 Tax=Pseudozobellia sp. WGM2 TaxID=2787625 RepID=UPI001ADFB2AC|nr:peptidase M61 [Pseudozobellia sp. WGM2]